MVRRVTKTGNGNLRGGAAQRRELKVWMLAEFGDGVTAPCSFGCGRELFYSEITKDRYPIPGRKGGKYIKGNVRPACMSCNARHGAKEAALERAIESARREVRNARRRLLYGLRKKGEVIYMADYIVNPENTSPEISAEEILANIRKVMMEIQARDPRNIVFEYTPTVEPTRAYFMKRELFEDGRHRIFLHSSHRPAVETWLGSL